MELRHPRPTPPHPSPESLAATAQRHPSGSLRWPRARQRWGRPGRVWGLRLRSVWIWDTPNRNQHTHICKSACMLDIYSAIYLSIHLSVYLVQSNIIHPNVYAHVSMQASIIQIGWRIRTKNIPSMLSQNLKIFAAFAAVWMNMSGKHACVHTCMNTYRHTSRQRNGRTYTCAHSLSLHVCSHILWSKSLNK